MAKKKKNHINIKDSLQLFKAYGLKVYIMPNGYQLRITQEESDDTFDWYHTTGALVIKTADYYLRSGTYKNAEDLSIAIMKKVYG